MDARLEVITGPMFSGKSEELIRRLTRAKIAGKKIMVVKPNLDTRYDKDHVTSHSGSSWRSYGVQVDRPQDVLGYGVGEDILAIDEVQFFDPAIVEVIMHLVEEKNVTVIVTGLDMTYRKEPFGIMPDLMARADEVLKLNAVCASCGEDAMMTQRLVNGNPAPSSGPTVMIGGLDSYEARCRKCHQVS
jgi:thymidine kinase